MLCSYLKLCAGDWKLRGGQGHTGSSTMTMHVHYDLTQHPQEIAAREDLMSSDERRSPNCDPSTASFASKRAGAGSPQVHGRGDPWSGQHRLQCGWRRGAPCRGAPGKRHQERAGLPPSPDKLRAVLCSCPGRLQGREDTLSMVGTNDIAPETPLKAVCIRVCPPQSPAPPIPSNYTPTSCSSRRIGAVQMPEPAPMSLSNSLLPRQGIAQGQPGLACMQPHMRRTTGRVSSSAELHALCSTLP